MADRPILFSAPMVRALLDGRKTQTRRILKPQPNAECAGFQTVFAGPPYFEALDAAGKPLNAFSVRHGVIPYPTIRFAKGDRLWVRESFAEIRLDDATTLCAYRANCEGDRFTYAGDGSAEIIQVKRWKPGIHMPRTHSRLTLTVTNVRVERLQDISRADAVAEGIERRMVGCADGVCRAMWFGVPHAGNDADPVSAYADLWDSINNPHGLCADDEPKGWAANPWVVAVSFTVERRNIDAAEAA